MFEIELLPICLALEFHHINSNSRHHWATWTVKLEEFKMLHIFVSVTLNAPNVPSVKRKHMLYSVVVLCMGFLFVSNIFVLLHVHSGIQAWLGPTNTWMEGVFYTVWRFYTTFSLLCSHKNVVTQTIKQRILLIVW